MTTEQKTEQEEEKEQKTGTKDNVVFIGSKPFMNYVTGVVMQFNTQGASEVVVKARGKFISKAVDVAEVARRKWLVEQKVETKDVKIGSEEFENKEGKQINVSIIEILLVRG
tara:strand:+ start:1024 stop:1359 length:336 start_codon:yes stop_codon:yes gene_type:complete